jgi:hypothetical protein
MRSTFLRIAMTLTVSASTLATVGTAAPAHAAANNCGVRGDYFQGYGSSPGGVSINGASSYIQARRGAVCNTDTSGNNFST